MDNKFILNIVTPYREFFSDEVESVTVNTINGEMGILSHALPIITVLKSGVIRIVQNGRTMEAAASDGIVTVTRDKVTVLTRLCAWPHEAEELDELVASESSESRKKSQAYEYKLAKAQLAAQFAKLKNKHGDMR